MNNNSHSDNNDQQINEPWDEELAQWYVTKYGDHPTNHKTVDVADLKPDDRVLDIGCGSGTAVREAAALVTSGTVTGIDPSPAMIRIANQKSAGTSTAGRIRFLVGSAEKLPVEASAITVAMAINSVHHWADLPAGLAEIQRVLVPGGRLIIGEEAPSEEAPGASEEREFYEDIIPVQSALNGAGFIHVTLSQHIIADGLMNVLQARMP